MNFSDRLALAWRVITDAKAASTIIPTWQENTGSRMEANLESLVRDGWRRNELIFACIHKTAATASFVKLCVKRKGDEEELEDHPLAQLIARPNPFMDAFDLWYSVVVFQKLAGAAYFEKERDRAGRVIALWPLRPDWVYPVRSSRSFIAGYEYRIPGKEPITLRPQDVIDFRLFDPLNQYRGYPPAAVAGRVGDVDNATTDYLKAFMEKGGMPPGILKTKQKLVDNDVTDIRRRWGDRYSGHMGWLQPAVLDQDAEYQKVGLSFQEMGFDTLDARSEARICMVLDVPPIMVGAKIGIDRATYSNYEESRKTWWEDTLISLYRNFENVINNDLVPDFGTDIVTEFDFSEVPALAENEDAIWGRANEGLSRGYVTVNEARKIVGLEAIGPLGDIFLRPLNVVETPLSQLRPFPSEETPDESPDEETDTPDEQDPADEGETEEAARYFALEAKARRAPDDAQRREFERQLREKLEPFFEGQLERIQKEIGERYQPMRSKNGHGTTDL